MARWPHLSESLPKLGTPEEVAEALRRAPKTIRRQLREGKIPGTKIDGRWYVNLDRLSEQLGGRGASTGDAGDPTAARAN